ncbi:MAG: alpha/beta hydrolase [Oscillospiraceae bacterium]|nr:alpha/beta hydrolase [Oscillospiraceae bacterium]
MPAKLRSTRVRVVISLSLILALIVAMAAYLGSYYRADAAAVSAYVEAGGITTTVTDGAVVCAPLNAKAGLIFYPGGLVEHTAYIPLMQAFAAKGVLCVLVQMPGNLAVLDMNAADEVVAQYPQITRWYISGHSLGGSMAASYSAKHADVLEGVLLLAAYSTADLANSGLAVLSVYGSEDGVLNMEKYETYRSNLPADFTELVIAGGNHAGFGMYGPQAGDGNAALPAEQQIDQTAQAFAALLAG